MDTHIRLIARSRGHCLTALTLLLAVLSSGCPHNGIGGLVLPGMRPPVFPEDSSVEDIVRVLNINTLGTATQQGLKSWSATNASVTVTGMVNVPATIAVEAPRNLRIRIAHPITRTELFDLGSNPDEFWVWARDSEPEAVMHVRHDEVEFVSQHLDLPIHPDWMMEVLGVVPLNPNDYDREESDAGSRYVELVGHKTAPNGTQVANVIRVDMRRGVIVRRSLHDEDGTVLGIAEYADHERDPQSQLMLPREITLEVPAMGSGVTFHLKDVQLNPPSMQARVWQPPQITGVQDISLADMLRESMQQMPIVRGPQYPLVETVPYYNNEEEGVAHTNPIRGIGGTLQSDGWPADQDDNLPPKGIADVDPTMNWGLDQGDGGHASIMTVPLDQEAMGGDAPPWQGSSEYDPAPVPYDNEPIEYLREPEPELFAPAVDDRPDWAREPSAAGGNFEFDYLNMR